MALGVEPVPGLERVILVGIDPDGRVHLMHSLFSVRVDNFLASWSPFVCLGDLPAKGLPLAVEIADKAFA